MSTVTIRYDHPTSGWIDITDDVLFRSAVFESQLAAIPGMCELTVKDTLQTHSFTTGRELTLDIDGQRFWGGFLTQYDMFYALLVDTETPSNVEVRQWALRGIDYNILLDKRRCANYASLKSEIPSLAVNTYDDDFITELCTKYLDLSGDGLSLSGVERVAIVNPTRKGQVAKPGETMREALQRYANSTGALYYINASKVLINKAREEDAIAWGFSDHPNGTTTFGPREIRFTEDGSSVVNDALVWGGSALGSAGNVTFGRQTNDLSIGRGLRMQYAEVRTGQTQYTTDASCYNRANIIVRGYPGSVAIPGEGDDPNRGLQNPQRQMTFVWFPSKVPSHILPGTVVSLDMEVFGRTVALPLRSLRIGFDTPTHVRCEGTFGINTSDPYSLWSYLKRTEEDLALEGSAGAYSLADDATTAVTGWWFKSVPTPDPDGVTKTFTLRFPYMLGSTRVYVDGVIKVEGTYYTESDAQAGEITFASAPNGSVTLYVIAQCL